MKTDLKVVILGSGTCVPSLQRSCCSLYIESSSIKLLADVGAGTMRRLLEAGVHINEISHIFISHFHPDHTGELASFLFSSKYPRLIRNIDAPLTILAGKGFKLFFDKLKALYGSWVELDPEIFRIIELETDGKDVLRLNNGSITTLPVNHNEESIAFRLEEKGKIIVYSGDTDYCENLITIAKNADLFICESALPDDLKVDNHLSPSTAGRAAAQANVKKLVLTHFYPECDKTDIAKECRSTYDGDLILAEDLMEFYI